MVMRRNPYRTPGERNLQSVNKDFTMFNENVIKKTKLSRVQRLSRPSSAPPDNRSQSPIQSRLSPRSPRAYRLNEHVATDILKHESRKGFRVCGYKKDPSGFNCVLFDLIDPSIVYATGYTSEYFQQQNYVKYTPLYDSRDAALSERFPRSYEDDRTGNPTLCRVLVAFDAWGKCSRRLGGGNALVFENARVTKIIEYLNRPPPGGMSNPRLYTEEHRKLLSRGRSPQAARLITPRSRPSSASAVVSKGSGRRRTTSSNRTKGSRVVVGGYGLGLSVRGKSGRATSPAQPQSAGRGPTPPSSTSKPSKLSKSPPVLSRHRWI